MEVIVVLEYLRRMPWASGRWACVIASGLARRGHEVTVLCDATERTDLFAPARVVQRRPLRRHTQRQPMGFARWAARQAEGRGVRVISFSRLAPMGLWMPVGPRVVDEFDGIFHRGSPVSMALALAHQPWLPAAWWAERRAAAAGVEPTDPLALGAASALEREDDAALRARRAHARAVLGLPGARATLLMSGPHARREDLEGVLGALRAHDAVLLVVGRRGHTMARWARAMGVGDRLRVIGPTESMGDALSAADLALVPHARCETARFAADALRVGRPVLVHHAGASARLALAHPEAVWPVAPAGWGEAIGAALGALPARTAAARDAGAGLGLDAWLDRLEARLRG